MNNEPFIVKHYTSEEGPIIKGNGFDGLRIGEDREEAEDFVKWINARLDLLVRLMKQVGLDQFNTPSAEEVARQSGHDGESGVSGRVP